jgi:sporulation protein YlmC with PRC-barrel domain
MAGAGVRLFTAGSQLLASQINDYLMDQVVTYFTDSAARDEAFGGIGEPSLSPGRVCYLFSDNKLYLYGNDNQWTEIGAQIDDLEVTTGKLADGAVTSTKILDGTILNIDINASAAIAYSKLNLATSIVNADINASAAIDKTKISGTAVTLADTGTITSTMIANDSIIDADIKSNAAIALGKLADATIDIKTANYTLVLTDKNKFIKMNITSTANTVTVPLDSTVTFPEGAQIHIIQYGTGKTQIVGASGSVILYSTPGAFLRAQYSSATLLKCAAANTWMLMGDLSAS